MQKAGHCIKKFFKMASKKLKGHKIEYFVLLCILVFGMIYFSYGAFMDHSYGFGDIPDPPRQIGAIRELPALLGL